MEEAEGRRILRQLVRFGVDELKYAFRACHRSDPDLHDAPAFCARRRNTADGGWELVRHIYVERPSGGTWADKDDGIEAFLAGAVNPAAEAMLIAHELGHALRYEPLTSEQFVTQDAEFERTRAWCARGVPKVPEERVDALYANEVDAWDRGARLLMAEEIAFKAWAFFEQERQKFLQTYIVGIRVALPAWMPTVLPGKVPPAEAD